MGSSLYLNFYELLKFSLKSVSILSEKYCNDMLKYEESKVATRSRRKGFLSLSSGKKKIQRFSVRYRSAILFKKLKELEINTF